MSAAGVNFAWVLSSNSPSIDGSGLEYVTIPASGTSVTGELNPGGSVGWIQAMLGLYTPTAIQNTPNDSNFFGMPF